MFNTLLYTQKLEAVGLERKLAEAHVQILAEIIEEVELATKSDLKTTENDLKREIKELEYRLTIRIAAINGAMITFAIALTTALAKLF